MTSDRTNQGLASMPAQERSLPVDGRGQKADQPDRDRRAGNPSAAGDRDPRKQAEIQAQQARAQQAHARTAHAEWDEAEYDEHDEAAGHRARRLLSRSNSGIHRVGDRIASMQRWLVGERWVRRVAIVIGALAVIFAVCFGGLWWRLGAGPINLDIATPWLAAAIEQNIGNGNTVEVGGTQIERAGRIRIAVRIRDIVVRDRDHAIVASAPKAEVRLSGMALLMGRLRAESLNLVDAELAVRITPDGQVTVSAGDTAKPLATGVASKKAAGLVPAAPGTMPLPAQQPQPGAASSVSTQSGLL